MFREGLKFQTIKLVLILAGSIFVGLSTGLVTWVFGGTCLAIIIWLLMQISKLEHWIHQARRNPPSPEELSSLWSDIAYDVQFLLNRHEKEKVRLQSVVYRVQEMTGALSDGVILIDRRGNMEWWNDSAGRLLGFRDVDRGHKIINLIRHPRFIKYFEDMEYRNPLEITMWRKDIHMEFQVHTFGEGERLVITRDITRLFKLEQMRKDFVANVSHELRTPLTVIRGYVETLGDSPDISPTWKKALQQMEQQCKRMTVLISDLITLAKLETAEKEHDEEALAIKPLIETIVSDAKAFSQNHHTFEIICDQDFALIANERELRSAITNLVINAVNYSGEGSHIQVIGKKRHDGASIIVKDNGIGIDSKHLPRLTERFYRIDPGRSVATGGTGLGLAIVKHVLLRHNSELQIRSQLRQGAEFICNFPLQAIAEIPARG